MVKNSFIEKADVVGTLLELPRRGFSNVYLHYVTEKRKKAIWKFTFSKYPVHCLYLF